LPIDAVGWIYDAGEDMTSADERRRMNVGGWTSAAVTTSVDCISKKLQSEMIPRDVPHSEELMAAFFVFLFHRLPI
jgi:hypothetical protein